MKRTFYPKPEGLRNSLLMCMDGLANAISNAQTAEDFLALFPRISTVGQFAAQIAVELGKENREISPMSNRQK